MVERRTVQIDGMSCGGCEDAVENAVRTLEGVHRVDANHEAGTLEVATEVNVRNDDIESTIHDAGYEVVD